MAAEEFNEQDLESTILQKELSAQIEKAKQKIFAKMLVTNDKKKLLFLKTKLKDLDKQIENNKNEFATEKIKKKSTTKKSEFQYFFSEQGCDNDILVFCYNLLLAIDELNKFNQKTFGESIKYKDPVYSKEVKKRDNRDDVKGTFAFRKRENNNFYNRNNNLNENSDNSKISAEICIKKSDKHLKNHDMKMCNFHKKVFFTKEKHSAGRKCNTTCILFSFKNHREGFNEIYHKILTRISLSSGKRNITKKLILFKSLHKITLKINDFEDNSIVSFCDIHKFRFKLSIFLKYFNFESFLADKSETEDNQTDKTFYIRYNHEDEKKVDSKLILNENKLWQKNIKDDLYKNHLKSSFINENYKNDDYLERIVETENYKNDNHEVILKSGNSDIKLVSLGKKFKIKHESNDDLSLDLDKNQEENELFNNLKNNSLKQLNNEQKYKFCDIQKIQENSDSESETSRKDLNILESENNIYKRYKNLDLEDNYSYKLDKDYVYHPQIPKNEHKTAIKEESENLNDKLKSKFNYEIKNLALKNIDKKEKYNQHKMKLILRSELDNLYQFLMRNSVKIDDLTICDFLWKTLFPYQQEAVKWMYNLFIKERGGVLADEMGLGKTLQVICLLSGLFLSRKIFHALIVAPGTVLKQWVAEFKRFFPFLRVILMHKAYTTSLDELISSIKIVPSVVLLSYEGFKLYNKILDNVNFSVIVLDEGHRIKNKDSATSKALSGVKCQLKVVLTGTPIQNNLKELWSIFNFTNKGLLGTFEEFNEEFEILINKGGLLSATEKVVVKAYKRSRMLRSLISPYLLRRLKEDVAQELPHKSDTVVFCRLTEVQKRMYTSFLSSNLVFGILSTGKNFLFGINNLRKICNHPFLHYANEEYLQNIHVHSGKLAKAHEFLQIWKSEGRKVLVFTQLIAMLNLFETYFSFQGFSYLRMDGNSSLKSRESDISKFNCDKNIFIFLLSTKVGGLGLNLTAASRVLLFDPDWNPSIDAQAKERAWRYGQKTDVQVIRMISAGTIEEKIYTRQVFKTMLSRKILVDPSLSKFSEFGDLDDLFSYNDDVSDRVEVSKDLKKTSGELDFLIKDLPTDIKNKFMVFKDKEILTDDEMIEYIILREENEA